jgi:hypothetical protein
MFCAVAVQVSQAEVLIEERDEEIRKIVETIAELAQIMRDLSTLVVEQGTMLDRIDSNITQAAVKVSCSSAAQPAERVARWCLLQRQLTCQAFDSFTLTRNYTLNLSPEVSSGMQDNVCSCSSCAL